MTGTNLGSWLLDQTRGITRSGNPTSALAAACPTVNVKDYGAIGNGLADDTLAFQAAMLDVGNAGGNIFVPPGGYIINSPLLWQPSPNSQTNQAFNAPSFIGAGHGASGPRFVNFKQGATQLIAGGSFPSGQFMIDYIGDTGANNCIAGYEISGLSLQCNSLAAGLRNCNAHTSLVRRVTVNSPVTPAPTNTIGSPSGAISAVASPTANAYNNRYEDLLVYGAGQDSFHFGEGTGSLILASNCTSVNATRYGQIAGDGSILINCSAQASGTADFEVWYSTLIGCGNQGYFNGATRGNAILFVGNNNRQAQIIGGCYQGNANTGTTGEASALLNFGSGGQGFDVVMTGVSFKSGTKMGYWFYVPGTATSGKIAMNSCSFNAANGAPLTAAYNIVASLSSTFQVSVRNCPGLNPFGSQTVAVPATTVATAALPFDSTFYVTAGATSCTVAISGGPTVTIPASACVPVRVPAGQTLTPTYTNAPTWVVEGE